MSSSIVLFAALVVAQSSGVEVTGSVEPVGPRSNAVELGVAGGASLTSPSRSVGEGSGVGARLDRAGLTFALRLAYLPSRWFGVEAEAAHVALETRDDALAELYTVRGHLIVQVPGRFTPFLLAGAGMHGASAAGMDGGGPLGRAVHWGAGVKLFTSETVSVRAEARHIVSRGPEGPMHDFEATLGIGFDLASGGSSAVLASRAQPSARPAAGDTPGSAREAEPAQRRAVSGTLASREPGGLRR
jgi:opacity protein-like surface antigen